MSDPAAERVRARGYKKGDKSSGKITENRTLRMGVTKENQVLDAIKEANVTLTAEETAELEKVADSLDLNVIRFWEKEMK